MILIIGDVMLDKYTFGKIERINPEAPVPILHVNKEEYRLGGAANVANNIASLGEPVILAGLSNDDLFGTELKNICENNKIEYYPFTDGRPTIVKQRFIAEMYNQQVLRVDYEDKTQITNYIADEIINLVIDKQPNIIIISDYNKGMITEYLMTQLKEKFSGKILVDPKPNNLSLYNDVFLIKPNIKELKEMLKVEYIANINESIKDIALTKNCNILVTLGKEGSLLYDKEKDEIYDVKSLAREVYDVSGAGDTYMATLAYALDKGFDLKYAMLLANKASSIVVGKLGTATITYDELFHKSVCD